MHRTPYAFYALILLYICTPSNASVTNPYVTQTIIGRAYSLAQEHTVDQESEPKPQSPLNVDPSHSKQLIEALAHANEDDQLALALKIAAKITQFDAQTITAMLASTATPSHEMLLHALTKNLFHFSPKDIGIILKGATRDITHVTLARGLKDNYLYLTGYTIAGYQLISNKHACAAYLEALTELNPRYHEIAIEPVLKNLKKYNLLTLIARTHESLHERILSQFASLKTMDLSVYTDHELRELLKLTKEYNQSIVAKAIAKSVHRFNGWHFYDMFKHCTDASRDIIVAAIVADYLRNPVRYDTFTRDYIAQYCTEKQKNSISSKAAS